MATRKTKPKTGGTPSEGVRRTRATRPTDMSSAGDMSDAEDMPSAGNMAHAGDMEAADDMATAGGLGRAGNGDAGGGARTAVDRPPPSEGPSGADLLLLARTRIGDRYVLGARVPKMNSGWRGPWDCAELVSWCLYQRAGILFGTEPRNDPMRADAYTGYWAQQSGAARCRISVEAALEIEGAALLRIPGGGRGGHIAFSDGRGGTVEAHSAGRGVIAGTAGGRRWDCGVLVPGIRYFRSDQASTPIEPPPFVLRLTEPLMRGDAVRKVQKRLEKLGYPVGAQDGIYGPQTAHAVELFQADQGLVVDGEVGKLTLKALRA